MRWLLFIILLPSVSALSIAASPDSVHLDANGEGALRLFNPNDEVVEYIVYGVWESSGLLEANSLEILKIVNEKFYGEGFLDIEFRSSMGSDKIAVRSGLKIPVSRIRPAVPLRNQVIVFMLIFVLSLIVIMSAYAITNFL
ncbi:MAG: hypothetical protein ACE5FT_08030 [Candidatus Nanoarchaeia archaeon]